MNSQFQTTSVTREQALEIAERATELLKTRFGATRVIVFGSARGDAPWHEGSDLDLAVEGLLSESFSDAYGALDELMPSGLDFDFVQVDHVPPELQARILGEIEMPAEPILALKSIVADQSTSLARLIAESELEYAAIQLPPRDVEMRGMATYVRDFYQATESIFERVAVYLDGGLPKGSDWHIQLLMQMYQETPTRPALLTDDELYARFDDYRKFRHIVRMAYRIDLDWDKLEPKILNMPDTFARLRTQLDEFFMALEQMTGDE